MPEVHKMNISKCLRSIKSLISKDSVLIDNRDQTEEFFELSYLKSFVDFVENNNTTKWFLAEDKCCLLGDKYLLAHVFAYFVRVKLSTEEFNPLNFFSALHIAHDVEEDDEVLKMNLPNWTANSWENNEMFFDKRRKLLEAVNFRVLVSKEMCEKIMNMEVTKDSILWKRNRQPSHAGAIKREWRAHNQCDACKDDTVEQRLRRYYRPFDDMVSEDDSDFDIEESSDEEEFVARMENMATRSLNKEEEEETVTDDLCAALFKDKTGNNLGNVDATDVSVSGSLDKVVKLDVLDNDRMELGNVDGIETRDDGTFDEIEEGDYVGSDCNPNSSLSPIIPYIPNIAPMVIGNIGNTIEVIQLSSDEEEDEENASCSLPLVVELSSDDGIKDKSVEKNTPVEPPVDDFIKIYRDYVENKTVENTLVKHKEMENYVELGIKREETNSALFEMIEECLSNSLDDLISSNLCVTSMDKLEKTLSIVTPKTLDNGKEINTMDKLVKTTSKYTSGTFDNGKATNTIGKLKKTRCKDNPETECREAINTRVDAESQCKTDVTNQEFSRHQIIVEHYRTLHPTADMGAIECGARTLTKLGLPLQTSPVSSQNGKPCLDTLVKHFHKKKDNVSKHNLQDDKVESQLHKNKLFNSPENVNSVELRNTVRNIVHRLENMDTCEGETHGLANTTEVTTRSKCDLIPIDMTHVLRKEENEILFSYTFKKNVHNIPKTKQNTSSITKGSNESTKKATTETRKIATKGDTKEFHGNSYSNYTDHAALLNNVSAISREPNVQLGKEDSHKANNISNSHQEKVKHSQDISNANSNAALWNNVSAISREPNVQLRKEDTNKANNISNSHQEKVKHSQDISNANSLLLNNVSAISREPNVQLGESRNSNDSRTEKISTGQNNKHLTSTGTQAESNDLIMSFPALRAKFKVKIPSNLALLQKMMKKDQAMLSKKIETKFGKKSKSSGRKIIENDEEEKTRLQKEVIEKNYVKGKTSVHKKSSDVLETEAVEVTGKDENVQVQLENVTETSTGHLNSRQEILDINDIVTDAAVNFREKETNEKCWLTDEMSTHDNEACSSDSQKEEVLCNLINKETFFTYENNINKKPFVDEENMKLKCYKNNNEARSYQINKIFEKKSNTIENNSSTPIQKSEKETKGIEDEGQNEEVLTAPINSTDDEKNVKSVQIKVGSGSEEEINKSEADSEERETSCEVRAENIITFTTQTTLDNQKIVVPNTSKKQTSLISTTSANLDKQASVIPTTNANLDKQASVIPTTNANSDKQASVIPTTNANLDKQATVIPTTRTNLDKQASVIPTTNANLDKQATVIPTTNANLDKQASVIPTTNANLDKQASVIPTTNANLDKQATVIPTTNANLDKQATVIPTTNANLDKQASVIPTTNANLDKQASVIPTTNTNLDKQATGVPTINTNLDKQATGVPTTNTNLNKQATVVPTTNTNLNKQATGVPTTNTNLNKQATGVPTTNTNLDKQATGVPTTNTNLDKQAEVVPTPLTPSTNAVSVYVPSSRTNSLVEYSVQNRITTVSDLKAEVNTLKKKVEHLEGQLQGKASHNKANSDQMSMKRKKDELPSTTRLARIEEASCYSVCNNDDDIVIIKENIVTRYNVRMIRCPKVNTVQETNFRDSPTPKLIKIEKIADGNMDIGGKVSDTNIDILDKTSDKTVDIVGKKSDIDPKKTFQDDNNNLTENTEQPNKEKDSSGKQALNESPETVVQKPNKLKAQKSLNEPSEIVQAQSRQTKRKTGTDCQSNNKSSDRLTETSYKRRKTQIILNLEENSLTKEQYLLLKIRNSK